MKPGILPDCVKCGGTDRHRMIALLTRFFGPTLELPDRPGYVYLCPDCYDRLVVPHLDEVNKLLRAQLEAEEETGEDRAGGRGEEDGTEEDPTDGESVEGDSGGG